MVKSAKVTMSQFIKKKKKKLQKIGSFLNKRRQILSVNKLLIPLECKFRQSLYYYQFYL